MGFEEPFEPKGGGSGVSDHGALTGLDQDHHLQYHTDVRGDVRYKQLTNERIVERPATDAASTYPLGISVMEVATSAGWPAATGTVETLRYSDGRTVQTFAQKNGTLQRVRWWNEVAAAWSSFAVPNVADFASASHVGSGGAAHTAATQTAAGFMATADKAKLDGLSPIGAAQIARVERGANLSVGDITWMPVPFDTEVSDAPGWYDPTQPGRLTVGVDGAFIAYTGMTWNSNATGARTHRIVHNRGATATVITNAPITSAATDSFGRNTVSVPYECLAGDYFTLEAWQNSGAALNFGRGTVTTLPIPYFAVVRVK